jgi:predicted small lipoprotein YifL
MSEILTKNMPKNISSNIPRNILGLVFFAVYLTLMGCGTKGPLYIPEQRYPQGAENNNAPKSIAPHALQANIHAPATAS